MSATAKRQARREALREAHQVAIEILEFAAHDTTGVGSMILYHAIRYLQRGADYIADRYLCASTQFWFANAYCWNCREPKPNQAGMCPRCGRFGR